MIYLFDKKAGQNIFQMLLIVYIINTMFVFSYFVAFFSNKSYRWNLEKFISYLNLNFMMENLFFIYFVIF